MTIPQKIQDEMCACCEWNLNKGGIKVFCFWPRGCVYSKESVPACMQSDAPYQILKKYMEGQGGDREHSKNQRRQASSGGI